MQIRVRQQRAHAVYEDLGGPSAQAERTKHVFERSGAERSRDGALSDVPRKLLYICAS